jgi:hypothetical protein
VPLLIHKGQHDFGLFCVLCTKFTRCSYNTEIAPVVCRSVLMFQLMMNFD